jgi:acyl-CoA dehydrogenase
LADRKPVSITALLRGACVVLTKKKFPLQAAKALLARTPKHKCQTRTFIAPAYNLAKKVMPKISDTERAALNSGTIAFDRDLFEGKTSVKELAEKYDVKLTPEEQAFMDNEVETLCEMVDAYKTDKEQNLSPEVWKYIREKKFMGLVSSAFLSC